MTVTHVHDIACPNCGTTLHAAVAGETCNEGDTAVIVGRVYCLCGFTYTPRD